VLGERRCPRHCATNSDKAGHVTKDQSGARVKGAGLKWREKKERGEVGRLGQNKFKKEEWPMADIKNGNPFIFSNSFF
jgi:hypothetical protein